MRKIRRIMNAIVCHTRTYTIVAGSVVTNKGFKIAIVVKTRNLKNPHNQEYYPRKDV